MNLSVRRVAEALELDVSGYSRIEQGRQQPKQATAREIFKFFAIVPLGMIYDPTHPTYDHWLNDRGNRAALKRRAAELVDKYPELADGDRRKARAD